jgi:hypothetical protein
MAIFHPGDSMAGSTRKSSSTVKLRKLGKTAAALAATALLEAAVQKVLKDPKFRRKAAALVKAAEKRSKTAGKKLRRAVAGGRKRRSRR